MRRLLIALGSVAALVLPTAPAVAGGSDAVPASTVTFDNCTATFVRSNSGIINETDRSCTPVQNPWVAANVVLQFRPLEGKPNPACDPNGGLVHQILGWTTNDAQIDRYFDLGSEYNVCVYLEDPVLATGSLDSADIDGVTEALALDGRYRIDITGTWQNNAHGLVDAEFVQQPDLSWAQGWPGLGEDFGDVLVNGVAVDWGGFNSTHAYSTTTSLSGSATLLVNDRSGALIPAWYADNTGSLSYTVTYLGMN